MTAIKDSKNRRTRTGLQEGYFESLSAELNALKNRVRSFIDDAHWLTDGEWKESVLRTFLRRNLPSAISVGRGFIISPNGISPQLDVLLYDSSKPILFRDGDTVFVTPEAVVGVIEVKTRLTRTTLRSALETVARIGDVVGSRYRTVIGVFGYELDCPSNSILPQMQQAAGGSLKQSCDLLLAGEDCLVELFHRTNARKPDKLRRFNLKNQAAGFFIHKIVRAISPSPTDQRETVLWFPDQPIENHCVQEVPVQSNLDEKGNLLNMV